MNEPTIEQLQAQAYRCIQRIESARIELQQINEMIARKEHEWRQSNGVNEGRIEAGEP